MRNYLKMSRRGASDVFLFFDTSSARDRERIRERAREYLIAHPDGCASLWERVTTLSDLHVIGQSVEIVEREQATDFSTRRALAICQDCFAPIGFGNRHYERKEGAFAHVLCS